MNKIFLCASAAPWLSFPKISERLKNGISVITLLVFFAWPPALFGQGGKNAREKYTVSFVVGEAEIIRSGKKINPHNGDPVFEGDMFHLKEKSVLEVASESRGSLCRISGPAIFRFSAANIAAGVRKSGILYSLMKKLTLDVVHYSPRTVVTAVRGKDDPARESAAAAKLKSAMELYSEGRYDGAWAAFDGLSRDPGLKKHTENLISFYLAEILFVRMDYAGALALYLPLHRSRIREFRHREICLARAIICAANTGDEALMKELAASYVTEYGETGVYYPALAELARE